MITEYYPPISGEHGYTLVKNNSFREIGTFTDYKDGILFITSGGIKLFFDSIDSLKKAIDYN